MKLKVLMLFFIILIAQFVVAELLSSTTYNLNLNEEIAGSGHLDSSNYAIDASVGQNIIGRLDSTDYYLELGWFVSPTSRFCNFTGHVKNETLDPIHGARIRLNGPLDYKIYTDENGYYNITVLGDVFYDLSAYRIYHNTETETSYLNCSLIEEQVDFVLERAVNPCEVDCTKVNDDVCHADCLGTTDNLETCNVIDVCNGIKRDVNQHFNETHYTSCCETFLPYTVPTVSTLELPEEAEHLVKTTRAVRLPDGRLVNMIVVVWE